VTTRKTKCISSAICSAVDREFKQGNVGWNQQQAKEFRKLNMLWSYRANKATQYEE